METLKIDGSIGHGGGQILRSALALSAILGKPFEMHSIRKDRNQSGLRRQHLCGVLATAEICGAKLEGAELGSEDLLFIPKKIKAGTYQFAVGTGGSVSLVLQSVLLPLTVQKMKSHISVAGGTYTPQAPTAEFFAETLVPRMNQMGYSIQAEIARAGFFRIGGGLVKVGCCRKDTFMPVYWMNKETPRKCFIQIVTSQFPEKTTLKIAKLIREELSKMRNMIPYELEITENPDIEEPGAAVIVRTTGRNPTVFSEIAQYGYTSEALVRSLGKQIRGFLAALAPIETHLADQIILPLFFAAGGSFLTKGLSEHLESCIKVLELFTGQKVKTEKDGKCLVVNVPKFKRENND